MTYDCMTVKCYLPHSKPLMQLSFVSTATWLVEQDLSAFVTTTFEVLDGATPEEVGHDWLKWLRSH